MQTFQTAEKSSLSHYFFLGKRIFGFIGLTTVIIFFVIQLLLNHTVRFEAEMIASLLQVIGIELLSVCALLFFLHLLELMQAKKLTFQFKKMSPQRGMFVVLLLCLFVTAGAQKNAVTRRDAATGMQTSYLGLGGSKTRLLMNGEVLGHTQIPLGEKFTIINEDVTGLTQKKGKVSVGCSLKIVDKKGRVLLQMADLFAANDIFSAADTKYLKCTVSTGKPMNWDEEYYITVVFWDKWGKGKMTNQLKIETIDLP
ncbi:MAG TPA: hypothetical protein VMR70_06675 [Flavisolibacter sp.]|nr:hypothetical protein [Flavisolibacter sp.]